MKITSIPKIWFLQIFGIFIGVIFIGLNTVNAQTTGSVFAQQNVGSATSTTSGDAGQLQISNVNNFNVTFTSLQTIVQVLQATSPLSPTPNLLAYPNENCTGTPVYNTSLGGSNDFDGTVGVNRVVNYYGFSFDLSSVKCIILTTLFSDTKVAYYRNNTPVTIAGVPRSGTPVYFALGQTQTTSQNIANATSSSLFSSFLASSTLEALAGRCSNAGNIFAEGLCTAGAFLFIPSNASVEGMLNIKTTAELYFPFSWIFITSNTFSTLNSTSSDNIQSVNLNLHNLGIGSTTPIGNILPNWTVLSSTTIKYYFVNSTWDLIQTLMIISIWLILIYHIVHTIRLRHHKI